MKRYILTVVLLFLFVPLIFAQTRPIGVQRIDEIILVDPQGNEHKVNLYSLFKSIHDQDPTKKYMERLDWVTPPPPQASIPIGIYNAIPNNELSLIKSAGFDYVQLYSTSLSTISTFLDACQSEGLKAIVTVGCSAKDCTGTTVTDTVTALKDKPALYAWYLSDDSDLLSVDPNKIIAVHNEVKAIDTEHPTVVSISSRGGQQGILDYMNTADHLWIWRYPIGKSVSLEGTIEDIGNDIDFVKAQNPNKVLWYTLQAFGKQGNTTNTSAWGWSRMPTQQEMRLMTQEAVDHGADGIIYYTYTGSQYRMSHDPSTWEDLKVVVSEIN